MKPRYIILIGALISVIGTLCTYWGFKIIGLLISTGGAIITGLGVFFQHRASSLKSDKLLKEIADLGNRNTELHTKLEYATKDILSIVRGGQDFIYIDVQSNGTSAIQNNNNEPVYNVLIEATDYDKLSDIEPTYNGHIFRYTIEEDHFVKCSFSFQNDVITKGFKTFQKELFVINDSGKYQIRIKSRYKTFYQMLVFKRIGEKFYSYYWIFEIQGNNLQEVFRSEEIEEWQVDFDQEFKYGIISDLIVK
jgi:hypothetical protein